MASQIASASNAADAAAAAGAALWVSGTSYTAGQVRYSPLDQRPYRRITNGAGTTDPRDDPVNWSIVSNVLDQLGSLAIINYLFS
jgi:hypothetical protein